MQGTDGERGTNSLMTFFYGLLHMDAPMLVDQQVIYIKFVWPLDMVWKICKK